MKVFMLQLLLAYCLDSYQCSSSSSGAGVAPQHCGTDNTNYYCPSDRMCKPRSQRCTDSEMCSYQGSNLDGKCFKYSSGSYEIRLGHADLLGSFGSKRNLIEHRFIQYRGFTYEFGKSYGVQILDINDPDYKYINNREINSEGITNEGYGHCTWVDATVFTSMWKQEDYGLITNNCQHFAAALKKFLTTGTCAELPSRRQRQDRMSQLEAEIDAILTDCDIVCCYSNNTITSSGASSSSSAYKVVAGLVAFAFVAFTH